MHFIATLKMSFNIRVMHSQLGMTLLIQRTYVLEYLFFALSVVSESDY